MADGSKDQEGRVFRRSSAIDDEEEEGGGGGDDDASFKNHMKNMTQKVMEQQLRASQQLDPDPQPRVDRSSGPVRRRSLDDRSLYTDHIKDTPPQISVTSTSTVDERRARSLVNIQRAVDDKDPTPSSNDHTVPPLPTYKEAVSRGKIQRPTFLDDSTEDTDDDSTIPRTSPFIQQWRSSLRRANSGSQHELENISPDHKEPMMDTPEPGATPSMTPRETSFSAVVPRFVSETDLDAVETGTTHSRRREPYNCTSLGPLNPLGTRIGRFCLRQRDGVDSTIRGVSPMRVAIVVAIFTGIVGLIVFLGVFPASFVYVEYYEIALLRNTVTGTVDRSTTYYPGCYVLGPQREFIKFNGTANAVDMSWTVFTADKLSISITFHLQYYIIPEELGYLHRKFGTDYDSVIKSVIKSEVRNSAVVNTIMDFRHKRAELEKKFHNVLKARMAGTCCPECCGMSAGCSNKTVCSVCNRFDDCKLLYHVEVRYFQLTDVSIENYVSERFLRSVLLQVAAEKEFLLQDYKLETKTSQKLVKRLTNDANEITQTADAESDRIGVESEADKEANITTAYVSALNSMYTKLGVTDLDHKLSIMMIRALDDISIRGNLYRSYNYDNMTRITGN